MLMTVHCDAMVDEITKLFISCEFYSDLADYLIEIHNTCTCCKCMKLALSLKYGVWYSI